jgi:hypothetical protein
VVIAALFAVLAVRKSADATTGAGSSRFSVALTAAPDVSVLGAALALSPALGAGARGPARRQRF